jgi:hypothetical protein
MPLRSLLHEYTRWALKHAKTSSSKLDVNLPFIDVYDAEGLALYHGSVADGSVGVLDDFPASIKSARRPMAAPTLLETFAMVPAFGPLSNEVHAGHAYTVLSVTVKNCKPCQAHDLAFASLRNRSRGLGVRMLEIELEK